jgi:FkbM family methyltransferase
MNLGSLKRSLKRSLRRALPARIYTRLWLRRQSHAAWLRGEPELRLLPFVVNHERAAIDVGAHVGIYTYFLKHYAPRCFAFEPNPILFRDLKELRFDGVEVHQCAISDRSMSIRLQVPIDEHGDEQDGLGTLNDTNRFGERRVAVYDVTARTLDDFDLPSIGFIKIDVEGHELEVLSGATHIIERDRPNFLIEAEERHRRGTVTSCSKFLLGYGYRGYFLYEGRLTSISNFDPIIYQNENAVGFADKVQGKTYINNFFFFHDDSCEAILHAVALQNS